MFIIARGNPWPQALSDSPDHAMFSYHSDAFTFWHSYQKTVHQFYLQLRQDILNGRLYCHEEASFILGGLALQAETGDYNEGLGDEYFLPEHYIPSRVHSLTFFLGLILLSYLCFNLRTS